MRICLVSRELCPFVGGGIATYIAEMGRALVAAGHETHILTHPYPDLHTRGQAEIPGAVFHAVDLASGPASIPGAYFCEAAQYAMAVYSALKALHAARRFDYIELPEYRGEGYFTLRAKRTLGHFDGALLAVRLHSPLYVCREFDREEALSVELSHIRHMELRSAAEADLVLSASRAMLDRVVADLGDDGPRWGQPREVLPLPMDIGAIAQQWGGSPPAPPIPALNGAARPLHPPAPAGEPATVLYFGRLQLIKGVVELVEAGKRLLARGHNLRFRFIGGDTATGPFGRSMLAHLQRLVGDQHRDRFVFEGHRPREQLGEAVRAAAVCCLPSRWESFSMACLEALAAGAVVVASDAGGLGEIIDDGVCGVTFAAGDVASLESALERALSDADLRKRLRENGPRRARQLGDAAAVVRRLERTIADAREAVTPRDAAARDAVSRRGAGPGEPELSVIIPFYNVGRYLPETLESLARQTYRDFELIIVNDGSTEPDSLALLDSLERNGHRVVHKPNGGLGSARNAGFRAARGRWVIPIDGDDIAHPTLAEKLLAAAKRTEDEGVVSVSPMFVSFIDTPENLVSGYVPLAFDRDLLLHQNIAGPGGGSILHRRTVLDAGGYDEWLTSFEDWDLWCRLAKRGHRGVALPEFLLYYRLRPGSLIRAEALPRMHALRAYLLARHADLSRDASIPLRVELAEAERHKALAMEWQSEAERLRARLEGADLRVETEAQVAARVEERARRLVEENIRYRLADRVNRALKATGVQRPVKTVFRTLRRAGRARAR